MTTSWNTPNPSGTGPVPNKPQSEFEEAAMPFVETSIATAADQPGMLRSIIAGLRAGATTLEAKAPPSPGDGLEAAFRRMTAARRVDAVDGPATLKAIVFEMRAYAAHLASPPWNK